VLEDEVARLKEIIKKNSKESEQDQISSLLDRVNELESQLKRQKYLFMWLPI